MDIMATTTENTATTQKKENKTKSSTLKNCYFYLHKLVMMAAVNAILLAVLV